MSAATLISDAAADGLSIAITDTGKLKLTGTAEAVAQWRDRIAANKPDIIAALTDPKPVERITPDPDALADDFEERAAIIEEGDRQPKAEAERLAWRIVYCARCAHYRPNERNPSAGVGRCATGAWERSRSVRGAMRDRFATWPMAERLCDAWEAAA